MPPVTSVQLSKTTDATASVQNVGRSGFLINLAASDPYSYTASAPAPTISDFTVAFHGFDSARLLLVQHACSLKLLG